VPSCLLAIGQLNGKHLITLEGLVEGAHDGLTPVMRAFLEESASQCGFCTPGFIIALTSWLAQPRTLDMGGAIRAIDGNLCRCTGYAAICRAARRLIEQFKDLPQEPHARLSALVSAEVLPRSVLDFMEETAELQDSSATLQDARALSCSQSPIFSRNPNSPVANTRPVVVGGGTDFYVRNPEPIEGFSPFLTRMRPEFGTISYIENNEGKWLEVGAAVTVSDFFASAMIQKEIPGIEQFETMFASTLVRNLATVGGNIVNASPVADITAMLLALRARLLIMNDNGGQNIASDARICPLEKFFLGYKTLDLQPSEVLKAIQIPLKGSPETRRFSFEKSE